MNMAKQTRAKQPRAVKTVDKRRERRGSLGRVEKNLDIPSELLEGGKYVGRYFNDVGNRIHKMTTNDAWDMIDSKGADVGNDKGKSLSKRVGTNKDGSPLIAYAMRILTVYYDENQAAKGQFTDEKMNQIRSGANVTGSDLAGVAYTPDEGVKL